jgi:hypothetical protein
VWHLFVALLLAIAHGSVGAMRAEVLGSPASIGIRCAVSAWMPYDRAVRNVFHTECGHKN